MSKRQRIICTVTNDLNYDQRMIRICTSLHNAGYDVTLIGFKRKMSQPLIARPFKQKRIPIIAEKGKLLYLDYWIKLFFLLLFSKVDAYCANDLDTILPVYWASVLRRKMRVFDSHELFTELKEVITRPAIHKAWTSIENFCVPKFPYGYTIGSCYAEVFRQKYGVHYEIVRNATILRPLPPLERDRQMVLYQGAVNVGRRFEELIPAMQWVNAQLVICGHGNFFEETKALIEQYKVGHKVQLLGYIPPEELLQYTRKAWVGITLFEAESLSNRLSMANRFFDYMHNGVPQIVVDYPEYRKVNDTFEMALLLDNPTPESIATAINKLLEDDVLHETLSANALKAREVYCWQEEEKRLLKVYEQVFQS